MGRVTAEDRVIGTRSYTVGYEYDNAGKMTSVTYPSGRTIFYDGDANGDISVVRQQPPGAPESWIVFWIARTPFGPRSGIVFANDMQEWRSYDYDGRITALETLKASTATHYLDLTYAYGDKRNLTAITDHLNAANNEATATLTGIRARTLGNDRLLA